VNTAHVAGPLAVDEQPHGADEVALAGVGVAGVLAHRGVHHGVDLRGAQHLGDQRPAQVRRDELDPFRQAGRRRARVNTDDPADGGVLGERGGQPATEMAGDTGHENDIGRMRLRWVDQS
jgi:hypothetical protein